MIDFTPKTYKILLTSLLKNDYKFQTFQDYIRNPLSKVVILRHDVDKKPYNSLKLALIENQLGIKSSYYFRAKRQSYVPEIINQIQLLGHEIGYHYESLPDVSGRSKYTSQAEMIDEAYSDFEMNLQALRAIADVKTICMHGSPMSKYDSRQIWTRHNYRELGIIGDFYYDVDYTSVFYLTDTGRSWSGEQFSVRDKSSIIRDRVNSFAVKKLKIRSTTDLINAALDLILPEKIIINTHPQRWNDSAILWLSELFSQNIKNMIKYLLIKIRYN